MVRTGASPSISTALKPEATQLVSRVRAAFRRVLSEMSVPSARARDLELGLRLHKTLAWKVFRVANSSDLLVDAGCIPGSEGVELFLRAAARQGASDESIAEARRAVTKYRGLVEVHADDRPSLEAMLRDLSGAPGAAPDLRSARRAAYRCASSTWGEQTQTRVLSVIYTPQSATTCDIVTIRGSIGLRRLREGVRIMLSRTIEHDSDQPGNRRARVEAVEPEGVAGGVPLLRKFCSTVPEVVADVQPDGNVAYRFVDGRVGNAASITAFTGDVRRNLVGALRRDEANTMNAVLMRILRPTALGVIDIWSPPGLWRARPQVRLLCAMDANPVTSSPETWRHLSPVEHARRLGVGADAAHLREVPEYSSVLTSVFQRLGWNADDYEVHRLRVEYPLVGTCLGMTVELNPAEGD